MSTTITNVTFNGGTAQRSTLTSMVVGFSAHVGASLSSDDLILWNATTGQFVDTGGAASVSFNAGTNTATWTFPSLPGGTLPDGNYRATLKAMSVHDTAGEPLDGDANGVGGDDPSFTFFRYFGDADGNRQIDVFDLNTMRPSIGRASPDPLYDARFDGDFDGDVDLADYNVFRSRLGKPLLAPAGNRPPGGPVIMEPEFDGQVVSGQDVHMEAPVFIDPDAGQTHAKSDWEIWTTGPNPVRVWSAVGVTTAEDRVHIHFGQGTFEGPQAGKHRLLGNTDHRLRTRHHDSSGDAGTAGGAWSVRLFKTMPDDLPAATNWTLDRPGFKVEEVPVTFDLPGSTPAERQFRMPTAISFVPNPTGHANDVLFYVADLYGTIWSVTHNYTVRLYADGLLNFNPSGRFAGDGETGLTGLTVDPANGDVYATMLFDATPGVDAGAPGLTDDTFPKVSRFTSTNGGLSAVDTNPAATGTQGQDVLVIQSTADSPEFQLQSHIISNISFGPDGKLYVHNGEGFAAEYARNVNSFRGKVLRLNKDGTAPADNPFYTAADRLGDGKPDAADYVYAMGFRNPFGGAWNPADGQHYQVENGPSANDRLSKVRRGVDYGWTGSSASMTVNALYNWGSVVAPVNIEFLDPNRFGGSGFPAYLQGKAFVTDSGGAWSSGADGGRKRLEIFDIDGDANDNGSTSDDNGMLMSAPYSLVRYTGSGKSSFIGLDQGPDGMYFTTLYEESGLSGPTARGGKIMRVVYVGTADFTANPASSASAPVTVQFTDTSDVPGASAWLWDFGDGATSSERNPSHTYTLAGSYNVTLTVTGTRGPVTVTKGGAVVVGNPAVGTGLRATYYDNLDFTGPSVTRVDPTVDFDWGSGSPHPSIGPDEFSSRWSGQIKPQFTQAYTFYTQTNDGVRLWVNGQLVINDWQNQTLTENVSAPVQLTGGVFYNIVMEHYEHVNTATARLLWSSTVVLKQVIPQSRLYPAPLAPSGPAPQPTAEAASTPTAAPNPVLTGTTPVAPAPAPLGKPTAPGLNGRPTRPTDRPTPRPFLPVIAAPARADAETTDTRTRLAQDVDALLTPRTDRRREADDVRPAK